MSPIITTAGNAVFSTGQAGSATVQASALPAATFSEIGALPAGLAFSSGGTLSGTPAAGTGGFYPITITASNGIEPDFTQSFGLVVDQPIVITSPARATFRAGRSGAFAVSAHGYPDPVFSATGTIPSWVTLAPSGVLTAAPPARAGGSYHFTIRAGNGSGSAATQPFTLAVDQPSAITSGSRATFRIGRRARFTIRTTGYPKARLTERGRLPRGIRFRRGQNGTAVLTGDPARTDTRKTYEITIIAGNGIGSSVRQTFRLKVS